jgi:transcriptional regulator with XRE-family HTH domain
MASARPTTASRNACVADARRRETIEQLDLASRAGTTPRYLSFLETGRSRPGRDLVLRLAAALDVPLRERNAWLVSAGLAPEFPDRDMADDAMRPLRLVLDKVLAMHEPYPAWVIAQPLRFVASNRAAEALFPGMCELQPEALIDLWCGPGPMRDVVENWQEVTWAGVATLQREAARTADPRLDELIKRAEAHLKTIPPHEVGPDPESPLVCARLRINGWLVRTTTAVMRFDAALDVTAADLRVELLFPADDASDSFFQSLASKSVGMAAAMPAQMVGGAAKDGSER